MGAPEGRGHDGAGGCGRRRHRRTHPREGQAGSHLHDRRRSAARSGRRQRPACGAGAARIGDAGAADRLRERRQPAADARDRASERGRHPHRARRGLAAAGAPAADRKRAPRDPRRRRRAAHRQGGVVRRPHGESGQHPAARGDYPRRSGAAVHVRGVDPDRHHLRAGAGLARGAARPQYGAEGGRQEHAGRGRFRQRALAAAQPAGRRGTGAVADAAGRRGAAGPQLRANPAGHARLQPGERDLPAARRERPAVPEPGVQAGILPSVRRSHRGRAGGQGARCGVGAAVHVIGRLGLHQRRRLDAAAGAGAAGRSARGDAGLLPDDGDPAAPGADVHELRRSAERRARLHHRREVRAALLAWAVGHRQAPLERSEAADDDRRRRRHGQAVRPRRRRPDRRLSSEHGLLGYQVARTSGDPAALSGAIVRAIHEIDPTIPVYDIRRCRTAWATRWRASGSRRSCWARSPCSR